LEGEQVSDFCMLVNSPSSQSTEARLSAENQGLNQERSSLNDLLRNLQTMQNEVERSSQESRRKLEQFNVTLSQQLYARFYSFEPG
jgi:hypothetical protein